MTPAERQMKIDALEKELAQLKDARDRATSEDWRHSLQQSVGRVAGELALLKAVQNQATAQPQWLECR